MEVTTISLPAISPTEGDDLCEADVPSVAIHSVTPLICHFRLAGNGAVLCFLQLKICNSDFFDMAFVDFLFLLLTVPSTLLSLVEDMSCSIIMPLLYLNIHYQLLVITCYWGLYWLMPGGTVYYIDNLWQLCCRSELPLHIFRVVDVFQCWAFFTLFTFFPMVTSLCPSHYQDHCQTALISMYTIILLLFVAPMVISSTIDFIKAKWGSQQQQIKRRDIVTVLTVLLTLLLIMWNFLQKLGYITVPSHMVFLLNCINSSFKPFIYFLEGRCWRPCSVGSLQLSLQRVFQKSKIKKACRNDAPRDTGV
ncbi:proto-oncogene Mas-like [Lonchura striata]